MCRDEKKEKGEEAAGATNKAVSRKDERQLKKKRAAGSGDKDVLNASSNTRVKDAENEVGSGGNDTFKCFTDRRCLIPNRRRHRRSQLLPDSPTKFGVEVGS